MLSNYSNQKETLVMPYQFYYKLSSQTDFFFLNSRKMFVLSVFEGKTSITLKKYY